MEGHTTQTYTCKNTGKKFKRIKYSQLCMCVYIHNYVGKNACMCVYVRACVRVCERAHFRNPIHTFMFPDVRRYLNAHELCVNIHHNLIW